MRYLICDLDGTLYDSAHRNHKLPAYMGKSVTAVKDRGRVLAGTAGTVYARIEREDCNQIVVSVRWHSYVGYRLEQSMDQSYIWDDFMDLTGQDFISWHEGMLDDKPIEHICWLLRALRPTLLSDNSAVMFLTSRWETFRDDTMACLTRDKLTAAGFGDVLEMRPAADNRKDVLVKNEILDRYEAAGHRFFMALDDRRALAESFRERGIPTMHVADYE